MTVIIREGREIAWLRSSNSLSDILGMPEVFPAERMDAYPISNDNELKVPCTIDILKPTGNRIYKEVEQKFIPHRHREHKQKGVEGGTWRASEGQ